MGTGWAGLDGRELVKLLSSLAWYIPSSDPKDEAVKLAIVSNFWGDPYAKKLVTDFSPSALKKDGRDVWLGLGELVEIFALHFSRKVPHNTPAGEKFSRILLTRLHEGEVSDGLHHRLTNADRLVIEKTGQLVRIVGSVEVKSSARIASHKHMQIRTQEESLRLLLEKIASQKGSGSAGGFFKEKQIEIAEPLPNLIFLPRGEGKKLIANPPPSWQDIKWTAQELELSLPEFIFLVEMLWPDFPEFQKPRRDPFLSALESWGVERLKKLFGGRIPEKYLGSLVLFSCLFKKVPVSPEGIIWTRHFFVEHLDDISRRSGALLKDEELVGWEKDFLRKFSAMHKYGVFAEGLTAKSFDFNIRTFIANVRGLRRKFVDKLKLTSLAPFDVTLLK